MGTIQTIVIETVFLVKEEFVKVVNGQMKYEQR